MNQVLYFSASGNSRMIATYVAEQLSLSVLDLTSYQDWQTFESKSLELAIVVLPIYGQKLNQPSREILGKINAKHFCFLFTFGKMETGNIIKEAASYIQGNLMAAGLVPTNHTYQDVGDFSDFPALEPLLQKIRSQDYSAIVIPHLTQSIFANVLPKTRADFNVSLMVNQDLCQQCGYCEEKCPMDAMHAQKINANCIRCLRCAVVCPSQAIEVKYGLGLRMYLSTIRNNEVRLYLV